MRLKSPLTVIWRAKVRDGMSTLWEIIEDTPVRREEVGLGDA